MLRIHFSPSPTVLDKLALKGPQILTGLVRKMNLFMLQLNAKIVGTEIPLFFEKGAPNIAASVRTIPARVEGTKIVGDVEAGGPRTTKETMGGPRAGQLVDYAAVQEMGVAHPWVIRPVLFSSAWALSQKTRALSVSGLPRALRFIFNGKVMIVRSVTHPGLRERPFMRRGLASMEAEIIADFQHEIQRLLGS
jgi:hypothetical protein